MVNASVEECWGKNAYLTYPSINCVVRDGAKVVRDGAITPHSTLCTRQAGYQVDKLWGYSTEGQDSPVYISVHRVERLADPYRLPTAHCVSHADAQ